MAIINTLLTARDQMSDVINRAKDNVKKSTKSMKTDLDSATNSAERFDGALDSMSNIDFSSFSGAAQSLQNIRTQLDAAESSSAKFLVRAGLLAGGVAAFSAGLITAVNSSSEYVNELNKISNFSGVTIERLQQMQATFRDTNLEVEKFGDINKDTLDHLGDAFRDGGGPAADMKAYGLNLQDFNKYLNQANGGINAVIHSFYEMRKAGKSQAEIVNMMETLASDSSHLITVLQKYGNEQEALNAISSNHASITEETARQYQEYQRQVEQLETTFKSWQANALSPTVEELNNLLNLLNGNWGDTNFTEWANKFMFSGDNVISQGLRKMGDLSDLDYDTAARRNLNSNATDLLNFTNDASKRNTPTGGWVDPDADKKAGDAAAKKFAAEQKAAQQWMKQLDINNASELAKLDINYDAQLEKLKGFQDKKLLTQQEYEHSVQALNSQRYTSQIEINEKRELDSLENKHSRMLMSEEEYEKQRIDIQTKYANERVNNEYNIELERLDFLHQQKLIKEEDYLNQVAGLNAKHQYDLKRNSETQVDLTKNVDYKKQAEDLQKFTNNMTQGISIASQFAESIASSQEEGTAAWYAATVAAKAMAVAQAIMMANLVAVQTAAYTPGPAGIAAGETARAWGYASAGMIAATGIMEIAGARERGGQVQAGKTYLVGEKGPELFTAAATGQISNNSRTTEALSGSDGKTEFNQYNSITVGNQEELLRGIKLMTESIIDDKLAREKRHGGLLQRTS